MGTSCSNQPLPSVRSRRLRPGRIRAQVEWTGGRVVEGARLERVYRGNSIEGSNPSLSATVLQALDLKEFVGKSVTYNR